LPLRRHSFRNFDRSGAISWGCSTDKKLMYQPLSAASHAICATGVGPCHAMRQVPDWRIMPHIRLLLGRVLTVRRRESPSTAPAVDRGTNWHGHKGARGGHCERAWTSDRESVDASTFRGPKWPARIDRVLRGSVSWPARGLVQERLAGRRLLLHSERLRHSSLLRKET
jgi:hypothetical protein